MPAPAFAHAQDLAVDKFDRANIKAPGRLRGDQQVYITGKLTRHDHLLLIAARQAAGDVIDNRWAHIILLDQLARIARRWRGHPPQWQREKASLIIGA